MSNKITIKDLGEYIPGKLNELNLNKIKEFINVAYYIDWYKSKDSNKVFPLITKEISDLNPTNCRIPGIISRNPFFDHTQIKYFIACNGSIPEGRIMAFIDNNYTENNEADKKIGWIGLFESSKNKEAAYRLFDEAVKYLKQNSCQKIIGPAKFNAGGEIGLLIKGFENKPYFMEPYNAPYYQDFFENYGFKKENDWYSISTDELLSRDYMNKIGKIIEKFKNSWRSENLNGFKVRNINFSNLKAEIEIIRELYNPLWIEGNHPQQVYMTDEEFNAIALGIRDIAIEDLIFIVEKENQPIAVSVNIPDINEVIRDYDKNINYFPKKSFWSFSDIMRDFRIFIRIKKRIKNKNFSRIRLLILGVRKECRKMLIDSLLFNSIKQKALEIGITHGSASQLADINIDIINPVFKLGNIAMTWRVYCLEA
ncbi:MAG: hypothetical protein FJW69_02145 [Actinobacteria bacterium]|nr:hypothetical protein [Actinomycetota bacterium]